MKRKSIVCSAALLASSIASAGTMGTLVEPDPFTGAYVGLGAGFGTNIARSYTLDAAIPGLQLNRYGNEANGGFSGQVIGGYGHQFSNHFYLGGDIFYNYLNPSLNPSGDLNVSTAGAWSVSETIQQTNSLGLAAHLGYVLGNVLPYGLIGAQYTPVKLRANDAFSGSPVFNYNQTFNQWGWLFGAGIQTVISEHFRAGLEYEYVYQNQISSTRSYDSLGTYASSFNPNMATIIARLTYVFNS